MPENPADADDPLADLPGTSTAGPTSSDATPLTRRSRRAASVDVLTTPTAVGADASTPGESAAPGETPVPGDPLARLFDGNATTEVVGSHPPHRSRRSRVLRRWIAVIVVLLVLGGIGVGGVYAWNTFIPQIRAAVIGESNDYAPGHAHGQALVTVVSGDNGLSISKALAAAGVTKTPTVFYDMLVQSGSSPTFYPGVYRLQKEMTAQAALKAMQDPATRMKDSALLREGITESQALQIVSQTLKMPLADLTAAAADPARYGVHAKTLEGWLFPAVYTFPPHATAVQVIQTMVDRTVQALDAAGVAPADRQRVLIIASIIQREARQPGDFYKVSRVIENRLTSKDPSIGGKLQMDSTAQYGYGQLHDGHASSSAAALASDNPWNTYVHPGLPIGPISNPGSLAIEAALNPAPGPWLYFTTVNMDTGETVFSATYAEQEKAVAQMRQWCTKNPDAGC